MCGRYTYTRKPDISTVVSPPEESHLLGPRFNIAPTQLVPLKLQGEPEQLHYFRWGLVPHWSKDAKQAYKMINARSETLLEKRTFAPLVGSQRCVLLADSFYEWKRMGKQKQPYRIGLRDFEPYVMAGLYGMWYQPDGEPWHTCTIVTTGPNDLMQNIHDRMPVILSPENAARWLDPEEEPEALVKALCVPFDADKMEVYPVSDAVGNVRNNDARLIEPIRLSTSLFED